MKRTPAQQKADKKYDSKRKRCQVNIKLSPAEKAYVDSVFNSFNTSKKTTLIRALRLLELKHL
jgi:hypothetical protein